MNPNRRGRRPAVALAAVLLLASCASGPSDEQLTAQGFQARVLAVTEAAAAENYEDALDNLETLTTEVNYALTRGEISADKRDSVIAAIKAVADKLEAAISALNPPAVEEGTEPVGPAPAPAPAPDDSSGADPGSDDGDGDDGPGNSGNNGNNGGGNGNGGGGNNGGGNGIGIDIGDGLEIGDGSEKGKGKG